MRLFTLGGMQREVLTLPGPIVALSGHKTKIMITVHSGMPIPGNQSISFAVFDIGTDQDHQVPNFQPLALAPKAFLSWQGFTDEGTPCLMDSAGYIRIWNNSYGSSWIQVCDSKSEAKGKSDHFFKASVSSSADRITLNSYQTSPIPKRYTYLDEMVIEKHNMYSVVIYHHWAPFGGLG